MESGPHIKSLISIFDKVSLKFRLRHFAQKADFSKPPSDEGGGFATWRRRKERILPLSHPVRLPAPLTRGAFRFLCNFFFSLFLRSFFDSLRLPCIKGAVPSDGEERFLLQIPLRHTANHAAHRIRLGFVVANDEGGFFF